MAKSNTQRLPLIARGSEIAELFLESKSTAHGSVCNARLSILSLHYLRSSLCAFDFTVEESPGERERVIPLRGRKGNGKKGDGEKRRKGEVLCRKLVLFWSSSCRDADAGSWSLFRLLLLAGGQGFVCSRNKITEISRLELLA